MIKKILFIIIFILALLFSTASIYALENRVFDNGNLLSDSEKQTLQADIEKFVSENQVDMVVLTTTSNSNKTAEEYANEFYDSNGFGITSNKDGMLLLIDLGNRKLHVLTNNKARDYISDTSVQTIVDVMTSYAKDGDYFGAFQNAIKESDSYFSKSEPAVSKDSNRVFDNANLLTPDEKESLDGRIRSFISSNNVDMAILTTTSNSNQSGEEYAQNFYNSNNLGIGSEKNGMLLLIDIGNRSLYVLTNNQAKKVITNSIAQNISNTMMDYASRNEFYNALDVAISTSDKYFKETPIQESSGSSSSSSTTKSSSEILSDVLISLGVGLVAGFAVCMAVYLNYKKDYHEVKYDFRSQGKLNLNRNEDIFINTFTTTRRIPRNPPPSSGGGFGGGGGSFGGGGGRGGGGGSF